MFRSGERGWLTEQGLVKNKGGVLRNWIAVGGLAARSIRHVHSDQLISVTRWYIQTRVWIWFVGWH